MKKHWLLIIGLIISTSILVFGNSAYNASIAQQSTASSQAPNKEVTATSSSNDTNQLNQVKLTTDKTDANNIKTADSQNESTPPTTAEQSQTSSPAPTTPQSQISNPAPTQTPILTPVTNEPPEDKPTPQQPTPVQEKYTVNLVIQNVGDYKIDYGIGDTAWNIMIRAQQKYGFIMKYQDYGWGIYVTQLGNQPSEGTYYWALYQNDQSSMVGITDLKLQPNDTVSWEYESWM